MATSIYVEDDTGAQYAFTDGLTGTNTVYIPPGETGTWKAVAERYGFKRQEITFLPGDGGDIPLSAIWVEDVSLSGTPVATVAAYTDLGTAQKVNDYEAYWRTTEAGIKYADTLSRNGETIDWTPYDVEIDPLAATPYSITGNKVTVKTVNLVANTITTTGVVSYVNGGTITGVVTDITGVSSQIAINNLNDCSVAIFDDVGDLVQFEANYTGSYVVPISSSESGDWTFIVTKFGHKPQTGTFTLGTGFSINIMWIPIPDDRVVATESVATGYTSLDTTQKIYDYWSYWTTLEEGIPHYAIVTWSGEELDFDGANVDFDPTATSVVEIDTATTTLTIKATVVSGDIRTTGTVVRLNGSSTTGLVSDATGVTAIVTFTGFTGTNKLYVEDSADVQRAYETITGADFVLYLLPAEQTNHPWSWAAKKTGYQHATGTLDVSNAGRIVVQVGMAQILQPDGTAMFTNTPLPPGISVDWTTAPNGDPRIKLGDRAYLSQDVYNATDLALSTLDGLKWLTNGNGDVRIAILPAGNFVFLSFGWRFMEAAVGNSNAGVNGFAISTDGQTIDDSNGPVSLLSTSAAISDADLLKIRETWDRLVNYVEPKVDLAAIDLDDIKGTGFEKDVHSLTSIETAVQTSIAVSA